MASEPHSAEQLIAEARGGWTHDPLVVLLADALEASLAREAVVDAANERLDHDLEEQFQRAEQAEAREAALREALERAVYLAERLWQMIPQDVWREHGAETMGHYEGDYHAATVRDELETLALAATEEEK